MGNPPDVLEFGNMAPTWEHIHAGEFEEPASTASPVAIFRKVVASSAPHTHDSVPDVHALTFCVADSSLIRFMIASIVSDGVTVSAMRSVLQFLRCDTGVTGVTVSAM